MKCVPLNCGTAQYKEKGKMCFNSCFEYENAKGKYTHLLILKHNMGSPTANDFKLLKRQFNTAASYHSGIQTTNECKNPTEPKL